MNSYPANTTIRLSVVFKDSNGTATDPTTVTATVLDPTEASTNPTVVKDSVGDYHADLTPSVAGEWDYTFAGTGSLVASASASFFIQPAL